MNGLELPEPLRETLSRAGILWFGTADAEGRPCVSPKELFARQGDRIVIADALDSTCSRNVHERPDACVSFYNWITGRGYALMTRVECVERDDTRFGEFDALIRKVADPDRPIEVIYLASAVDLGRVEAPAIRRHPVRPRRALLVDPAIPRIELI